MKNVPWGDIPDSSTLPDSIVRAALETLEKVETKPSATSAGGKLMYKLTARISEPKQLKGMAVFDNYVIGSEDDPEAENNDTLIASIGLKRMKKLFEAAGADLKTNKPPLTLFKEVKGKSVVFEISKVRNESGPFKGRDNNNVVAIYKDGAEKPRLLTAGDEGDEPAPRRRAAAPAAPVADEGEGEEGVEPAEAPAPKRRTVAPKAPEPEEGEGDVEAVEPEIAEAPPPKRATTKLKDPVKCPLCKEVMDRSDYDAHVDAKHADE